MTLKEREEYYKERAEKRRKNAEGSGEKKSTDG